MSEKQDFCTVKRKKPKILKRVGKTNNQIYYEKITITFRVRILIVRMWRFFPKTNGRIKNTAGFQPDSKRQACKII
ncbi:MAG TPA: hypothetical protein DCG33_07315 [Prevotellaceae bacterium]|nr:hypothetical protein [Prevotellaceae bacterium]